MASARALHADGLKPRNKVGILMGNRVESLIENFAIQCRGATSFACNEMPNGDCAADVGGRWRTLRSKR
jgi:long-subunit acyl-CoA synthetase (AMP-forming)